MIICNFEKEGDMGKYHAVQEKHWRMWEKAEDFEKARLPDGESQIFRLYVFGPPGLKDYGSATLRCKI